MFKRHADTIGIELARICSLRVWKLSKKLTKLNCTRYFVPNEFQFSAKYTCINILSTLPPLNNLPTLYQPPRSCDVCSSTKLTTLYQQLTHSTSFPHSAHYQQVVIVIPQFSSLVSTISPHSANKVHILEGKMCSQRH